MKIPDYISPVVAYRVWRWKETGLQSLNGEPWLPGQHLEARCRVAPAARHMVEADNEVPHRKCTCGIYAAKNSEHLRQIGYADGGICGEVYLWGTVVEHKLGWRAQFAYPKSLVLPLSLLPFTLAELNTRLLALIAFGIDIFVLHNRQSIRLWKHGQGYGTEGLDYIISLRVEHCLRQQEERKLKKGDRVALLGRGIAVVQQVDHKAAVVVLGNRVSLKIARREIVLNKQNMRWECETKAQLLRS
jgi:preprotein translocase subunit YajC